eukprot:1217736-Rhodomonas_salina.1
MSSYAPYAALTQRYSTSYVKLPFSKLPFSHSSAGCEPRCPGEPSKIEGRLRVDESLASLAMLESPERLRHD